MNKKDNCIFCKIIDGQIPFHKIYEDGFTLAFLDINPKTDLHTIVIPKKHSTNILDVSQKDLIATINTVQKICRHYANNLKIKNLIVRSNAGEKAGQSVMHLHFHIIPKGCDHPTNTSQEFLANLASKVAIR